MSNIISHFEHTFDDSHEWFATLATTLSSAHSTQWENLGGQPIPTRDLDQLRADIRDHKLCSWAAIHQRYDTLWEQYPIEKMRHAFAAMCSVLDIETFTADSWLLVLAHEERILRYIAEQVYLSRKKDFDNPFRLVTSRSAEESIAVYGTIDDDSFVRQVREETTLQLRAIERMRNLIQL